MAHTPRPCEAGAHTTPNNNHVPNSTVHSFSFYSTAARDMHSNPSKHRQQRCIRQQGGRDSSSQHVGTGEATESRHHRRPNRPPSATERFRNQPAKRRPTTTGGRRCRCHDATWQGEHTGGHRGGGNDLPRQQQHPHQHSGGRRGNSTLASTTLQRGGHSKPTTRSSLPRRR